MDWLIRWLEARIREDEHLLKSGNVLSKDYIQGELDAYKRVLRLIAHGPRRRRRW